MAHGFSKKLKELSKSLFKKVAGAFGNASNNNDKSSYEAVMVSPATPKRTPSEKRAAKERARLPCASPAQERFPIDD